MAPHARCERERGLRALYDDIERPLVPVLAAHGARTASASIRRASTSSRRSSSCDLDNLTREIYALAGEEFNIGSPKQLAHDPLREAQAAAGAEDQDRLLDRRRRARASSRSATRCPPRSSSTARSPSSSRTYADALPDPDQSARPGRIHTVVQPARGGDGAAVARSNPNLRTSRSAPSWAGASARRSCPRPGWRFVAADYSQIELRILAHVSGEESLIEAFRRGEDIHRARPPRCSASRSTQVTLAAARRSPRPRTSRSSTASPPSGCRAALDMIDQKQAQEYIDRFFAAHPQVRAYHRRARSRRAASAATSRRCSAAGATCPSCAAATRTCAASASAWRPTRPSRAPPRDLIKIAMVRMARGAATRAASRSRMLLQVHDELLFEAPPDEVERARGARREVMESALPLSTCRSRSTSRSGADWAEV